MPKSYRKQPGALDPKLSNAREAAVAELMSKQSQKAEYSFDRDGGAQGSIVLGAKLPSGSMVTNVWFKGDVAATSGGTPTIKITCGGTDVTADFWALAAATANDEITLAAPVSCSGELAFEIGTADLTAGSFSCFVEFVS